MYAIQVPAFCKETESKYFLRYIIFLRYRRMEMCVCVCEYIPNLIYENDKEWLENKQKKRIEFKGSIGKGE